MKKDYLLFGSFAYDTILHHDGLFENRVLKDSLTCINVAFGVGKVKNELGGTAGNIVHNASLLNNNVLLIGNLGNDSDEYLNHLKSKNIEIKKLKIDEKESTAHAWILNDKNNNQITSFYGGAMNNKIEIPEDTPDLWHIAPEAAENMVLVINEAIKKNKRYYIDPGQALPSLLENNNELDILGWISGSEGVFLNEYESELLMKKLSLNLNQIAKKCNTLIINTLGSKGVVCYSDGDEIRLDVIKPDRVMDSTGCGDAFRAGYLYGLLNGWNIELRLLMGNVMGSYAIEQNGGQNHKPSYKEILSRLYDSFGLLKNNKMIKNIKI